MTTLKEQISFRTICLIGLCILWIALTFSNALVEISFVFSLVMWVLWKIRKGQWISTLIPRSLMIPLLGFVLLTIFSYFWSEYPAQSFRGVMKVLQQFMIFYMVVDVFRNEADIKGFEVIFLVLYGVVIVNGFYQYWAGYDFIRGFAGEDSSAGLRVSASFKSYGLFGAWLIMTIPLLAVLGAWFKGRKQGWVIPFFCALLTMSALILLFFTRSRGAFLAICFGGVFYLIFKRKFIILFLLLLALVGSVMVLPRGMIIHLDADGKEQSIVERYYLWDRAVHVIKARPLRGTGINTYAVAHSKYDKTQNWRVRDYYAHNGYLQMAAETGIPCLLFFLWFLLGYFYLSLRPDRLSGNPYRQNIQLGMLTGIFSFLILVGVDTVLHNAQPAMTFWYLLGIQWAHRNVFFWKEPV